MGVIHKNKEAKGKQSFYSVVVELHTLVTVVLQVGYLTEEQFWEPIQDKYVSELATLTPEEVFPSPNPGTCARSRIDGQQLDPARKQKFFLVGEITKRT